MMRWKTRRDRYSAFVMEQMKLSGKSYTLFSGADEGSSGL